MPRNFHRRIIALGGIPYDLYLKAIDGVDWFMMQEQSGSVALSTNSAATGRELLGKDFTNGVWIVFNSTVIDLNSFSTLAGGGMRDVSTPAISTGKKYIGRVKGTTTGGSFNVRDGTIRTTIYGASGGTGAFDLALDFTAASDGIYLKCEGAGTTDIDWANSYIKQTGILASSAYADPTTNPMVGTYSGVTLGGSMGYNLGYAPLWDGGNDNLAAYSAEKNSKTIPTSYHELTWVQKDTWDTTERDILSFTVDADNWIRIVDTATPGTISWQHRAGGTTEEVTLATGSPTGPILVGISNESGVMKAWYNAEQTGSDQSVAGTFAGNFKTMNYGSRATSHYYLGRLTRAGSADHELSVSTWSGIYRGGI